MYLPRHGGALLLHERAVLRHDAATARQIGLLNNRTVGVDVVAIHLLLSGRHLVLALRVVGDHLMDLLVVVGEKLDLRLLWAW